MFKGILLALFACFIWGLIFVVPQFMSSFSPMEIMVGRYWCFGGISLLFLLLARMRGGCNYTWTVWNKALLLSFLSGYYFWLVLSIRYSSPEVSALIMGTCPITIACYGNWKEKEVDFKALILPSVLIVIGLICINAPHLMVTNSYLEYSVGVFFSVVSLVSWSLYVVLNSRYLKQNPHIHPDDWATMQGVTTFSWATVVGAVCAYIYWEDFQLGRYLIWTDETAYFLLGCATLGLVCSWGGNMMWNKASTLLPVSLAGQLMIFETIFGVIYVFILNWQAPSFLETFGIILLLGAVIHGIRVLTPHPVEEPKNLL